MEINLSTSDASFEINANGTKIWYQNGLKHRTDGPAIEYMDGTKYWYQNGEFHRLDGPAIKFANGIKRWYVRDQEITYWIRQQGISETPTKEEQMLIRLTWG